MTRAEANRELILGRARSVAEGLNRDLAVRTGFGGELVMENALVEMAVFSIGVATGREDEAHDILRDAAQEKLQ